MSQPLDFGLMFFAASDEALSADRYRLIIESARFADANDLSSVWVPERHFTEFGCLYPNPAVLHAALARETERVRLCAGSVVIPLHPPIRIAEDWAMVDNFSGGRVGLSAAPGWNPNDFCIAPEAYAGRQEEMYRGLDEVRRLWRGESIEVVNGIGEPTRVSTFPRPVQPELPVWVTAAGNPATFRRAGEMGVHLLTHLLDHDVEDMALRIAIYREARRRAGHDPAAGRVTLMLHTFLGEDADTVREQVRGPYCTWLKSNAGLLKGLAANRQESIDLDALSDEDLDRFVNFLFERFFASRSLMGTPETCLPLVARLHGCGVDEIACLLDFGPRCEEVLEHLPHLVRLRRQYLEEGEADTTLVEEARRAALELEASLAAPSVSVARLDSPLPEVLERCTEEVAVESFYDDLRRFGADFGSRFRGIETLRRRDGEAVARVRRLPELMAAGGTGIPPAFLDACFQVIAAALPTEATQNAGGSLFLPVGLGRFEGPGSLPEEVWSHAVLTTSGGSSGDLFEGDIRLLDGDGETLAEVGGFRIQKTHPGAAAGEEGAAAEGSYRIAWRPVELPEGPPELSGTWLVLSDSGGVGAELAERLTAAGAVCRQVLSGERGRDGDGFLIDPAAPEDARWLLEAVAEEGGPPPAGIVHLWSLEAAPADELTAEALGRDATTQLGSVLHLVQALVERGGDPCPLWLVSRGAQPAGGDGEEIHPTPSLLWGFGKTLAVEHPELWGGLVDLDPGAEAAAAAESLLPLLAGGVGEDQLALRGGEARAARLVRWSEPAAAGELEPGGGTYLVTGGFGGIGLAAAQWLARRGARHLFLVGRHAAPPREEWDAMPPDSPEAARVAAVKGLEEQGAEVGWMAADVADEAQVASLFSELANDGRPPLEGIFHAAGIGHAEKLVDLDLAAVDGVLRPKVQGTWLLHQAVANLDLEHFVLFSSATHQLGLLGQGVAAYSAANAFLDGLAHHRRGRGATALSIDWGPWSEVGLAAESGNDQRLRGFGIEPIVPEKGFETLGRYLATGAAQGWALDVDWKRLFQADPDVAASRLLAELLEDPSLAPESAEVQARRARLLEQLEREPARARSKRIQGLIQDEVVLVMGLESREVVDWRRGLFEIGLDSLMALELKNRLQSLLGLTIPATLVFDYPTIEAMAGYLAQQLFPGGVAEGEETASAEESRVEEAVAASAAEIEGLSDEEMERLLEEKLETL